MKSEYIGASLFGIWLVACVIMIGWYWRLRHRVLQKYRRGRRWSPDDFIAEAGPTRHVNPVALEITREAVSVVTGIPVDRLGPHDEFMEALPVGEDLFSIMGFVQLLLKKRHLPRFTDAEQLAAGILSWVTALDVAEAVTRHLETKQAWQSVEEVAMDSR